MPVRRRAVLSLPLVGALALAWGLAPAYAAPPAGAAIVKIGVAAPLTGFSASNGKDVANAARLAFEEANAAGLAIGGRPVRFEVDSQDDAADPKTAVLVAQRFADEGVSGVIGHYNSSCSIAASAVYQRAGIPQISPTSSSPLLTARGFDTTFRTISNDRQMAALAAHYSVATLGAKRIAVIDDSTDYGTHLANAYAKSAAQAGAEIVSREYASPTAIDFRALLTTVKGLSPDLILYVGQDLQAASLAKQIHQLGIKAALMGEGGFTNAHFLALAGAGAKDMYSWEYGLPRERMPQAAELDAKLKARFGAGIVQFAPLAYDAAWAMIRAMQAADSTAPQRYLPALRALSFEGVTGTVSFTAQGDRKLAFATLYREQAGEWAVQAVERTGRAEPAPSR
ncbi:branched-chain amino acid ABC transporter substrate-binding protein [Burkholderia sp. Ac-20379]|uniref:branched-chain amino acid ABC transporter substrate-binding protein n=1 Tax=Burkholderia sp. Ac-20379 TaxID=2703900 RepID=UPI001980E53B|nr:branched-chain amino acid ABC transporter substrate-binding protein [Burkholderia sp. Ac-20379]MBN3724414.1 branched-chain amino acid ABC transporter substrate-binding protein [Burkholderia sp. Ac-20379]